jgi:hypothetical protein
MITDILVHIPTERPARPVIDASISLAASFGAHLDVIAIGYVSNGTAAFVMDGSAAAAVAAVFEMEQERAAERATVALTVFEAEARHAGISYQSRAIADLPGDAAASIGAAARLRDLAVVLQPEAERQTFDNSVPMDILLQAGSPVLFVPRISRGPFMAKRIGICWDGSRIAARALKDAMPCPSGRAVCDFDQWRRDRPPGRIVRKPGQAPVACRVADQADRADGSEAQPSILSRHAGHGSLRPLAASRRTAGRRLRARCCVP